MKALLNSGVVCAFVLLTACGGGSDSGDVGGGSGGNNQPPILITAADSSAFAAVAVNTPEGMLQIGHYTDTLAVSQNAAFGRFQLCSNGGGRTVTVSTGLPLQQGSVITDKLEDCYLDSLNAVLQGEVTMTVTSTSQSDTNTTLVLDVNLSKALFKDSPQLTILDPLRVSLTNAPLLKQIKVEPRNSQVRFDFADGERLTLSQFTLTSQLDLSTALYNNEYQGRLAIGGFSRDLLFKTAVPLQGYIGEFPHQGRVDLSDSQNNILAISANQVINSELANVKFNTTETALYYWFDISDGAFWHWPGIGNNYSTSQFRHDNFALVSIVGKTDFTNFPTQGKVSYLFSRPVKDVSHYSLANFFSNVEWGYDSIAAEVTIEGALVHLTPVKPLIPGATYRLSSAEVISSLDRSTYIYSGQNITVSNAVKAVLSKDQVSFSINSGPTLSATQSVLQNPTGVTYQWQELSDIGVVFENPNLATTSFSVSGARAGQVANIRLNVTDALGNSHSEDASFYYHDSNMNVFYYESDRSDYIGQGQTRYLTTDNGVLSASTDAKSVVRASFSGQDQQSSIWWYMNFATASGTELAIGRYNDAIREPFQSETGNGLSIYGNGRGCNNLTGYFEIFEIEFTSSNSEENGYVTYNISKLALDYVQNCEGLEPAMRGKIRINSSYKL